MPLFPGFNANLLRRNPMSPTVSLDGSDTVPGLRTLERLRLANLAGAAAAAGGGGGGGAAARRRAYRRFRGPFIEQLSLDDFRAPPKPWAAFFGGGGLYDVPASAAALCERAEENLAAYAPNYARAAAAVLLATFYLRPVALIGAAALAYSAYRLLRQQVEAQRRRAEAAARRQQQRGGRAGQQPPQPQQLAEEPPDAREQAASAAAGLAAWALAAATRAVPVLLLGLALAAAAVGAHAAARRAPSEARAPPPRGGAPPISYSFGQVLGRAPAPGGDPRRLFRELATGARAAAARRARLAARWAKYYWLALRDGFSRGGAAG